MTDIIPIPFSGGGLGHGNGANEAPEKIIKELQELYANEDGMRPQYTICKAIRVDEQHLANSHEAILHCSMQQKKPTLFLGGDHSITHPLVKGYLTYCKDFHLIIFDAHPDLMDDFRPPTQEDYLRVLVEENIVLPENITLIGLRNWDAEEVQYLKEKKISYYRMVDVYSQGIESVISNVLAKNALPLYVSVDIDVVDPVEAIGTGYLEHGGMSSRELIMALQRLRRSGRIQRCDIVEVNPSKDINNMTSKLAAKCLVELVDAEEL